MSSTTQKKKRMVGDHFEYLEVIENLKVESIDPSTGSGICRNVNETIRVPAVIEGEVVSARVYRKKDGVVDADLVEIHEAAPIRVKPSCEFFETCSGCQFQHIEVEKQRDIKRNFVIQALRKYSNLSDIHVSQTLGGDKVFGYRSKLTPRFDLPRRRRHIIVPSIGIRERGRFRIVDISKCLIASNGINDELLKLREEVHEKIRAGEFSRGAQLLLRDDGTGKITTDQRAIMETKIGGITFEYLAHDFFQVNHEVTEILVREVLNRCESENIDFVADMYSGCGMFAVHIAAWKSQRHVVGVEVSKKAVECARRNAKRAGLQNISFECGHSESIFESLVEKSQFNSDRTCVVIDPPRNGCDESFLSQLLRFGPQKIVYVSCNPETLSRDLASLFPYYRVDGEIQPLDMFPQTRHVECVVSLMNRATNNY